MDYTKQQPNLFSSNNLQIVIIIDDNSSAQNKLANRKVKAVDPANEAKLIWMIVLSVFCMILSIFVWCFVAYGQYFREFFTILKPESDTFDCYDSCFVYVLTFQWACLGSYVAYQLPVYLGIFIVSLQAKNDSSFSLSQGTAKLAGSIMIGISSVLACVYLIYPYFYMSRNYGIVADVTLGIDVLILVLTLLQEVFFMQIL
eukprot:403344920